MIEQYTKLILKLLSEKGRGLSLPMFNRFMPELSQLLLQDISTVLPVHQSQSDSFVQGVQQLISTKSPTKNTRIVIMPGGGYGQWLAEKLRQAGVETVAYLDNYKGGQVATDGQSIYYPNSVKELEYHLIVIATPTFAVQLEMADQLASLLGKKNEILLSGEVALAVKLDGLYEDSLQLAYETASKINAMTAVKGRKTILFALPSFPAHYLSTIRTLRRRGHLVTLLSNDANVMYGPRVEEYECEFDLAVTTENNLLAFLMIISQTNADHLYAVDYSLGNHLALMIRDLWQGKMLMEVYDFSDNVQYKKGEGVRGVEKQMGGVDLEGLENYAREKIYHNCDGLIYRDSPQLMERAKELYKLEMKPSLRFLPYPERYDKLKDLDRQEHIVFCGHILNRPDDLVYTVLELARELAEQKMHMHFFNPADPLRQTVTEYIAEANSNPFIHYHRPISTDILNFLMRQYNWAWLVYDFKDQSKYDIMRHELTFTSRLLSYITAGLPCICSRESTYQVELIEQYGIGVVVDRQDVPNLGEILAEVDYISVCANVQTLRKSWDMGQRIEVFEQFMDDLTNHNVRGEKR